MKCKNEAACLYQTQKPQAIHPDFAVSPQVEMPPESFSFDLETTIVQFEWKIITGNVMMLQLQYL